MFEITQFNAYATRFPNCQEIIRRIPVVELWLIAAARHGSWDILSGAHNECSKITPNLRFWRCITSAQ
jgi:hypothetical protein